MSRLLTILLLSVLLYGCAAPNPPTPIIVQDPGIVTPTKPPTPVTPTELPTIRVSTPTSLVPSFEHIVLILFENKEFGDVIGNQDMPEFNRLADNNTLLTQYFAVRHPSLPNYIALIGGDTFGIDSNCKDCFINAPSLPDLIEASGRSWKTYQEDMPEPCYLGSTSDYAQKHNPFVYFDPIRLNKERCERSVVPLTDLNADILGGSLPNFIFITPNLCNDSHDCSLDVADNWLKNLLATLVPALDTTGQPYLVVLVFDEGDGNGSCCGLPAKAGGRVPVVLISSLVKEAFQDDTPYTHYSLLKTISASWGLNDLGHAADENNVLISAPWE